MVLLLLNLFSITTAFDLGRVFNTINDVIPRYNSFMPNQNNNNGNMNNNNNSMNNNMNNSNISNNMMNLMNNNLNNNDIMNSNNRDRPLNSFDQNLLNNVVINNKNNNLNNNNKNNNIASNMLNNTFNADFQQLTSNIGSFLSKYGTSDQLGKIGSILDSPLLMPLEKVSSLLKSRSPLKSLVNEHGTGFVQNIFRSGGKLINGVNDMMNGKTAQDSFPIVQPTGNFVPYSLGGSLKDSNYNNAYSDGLNNSYINQIGF